MDRNDRCIGAEDPRLLYVDTTDVAVHIHCMHKHDDIAEILLIQSGCGTYCVENSHYSIEAGDVVICNAGSIHDQIPSENGPYITSCIGMTNLLLPELPANCLIPAGSPALYRHPVQFAELCALTQLMRKHLIHENETDRRLSLHLMLCFLELVRQMIECGPKQMPQRDDSVVERVKLYIDEHYADDLSLASLSLRFNVSPYYLSHLFKQHFEYPLMQYVIRRRIGEAQSLLMNTRLSITAVSSQTGFTDMSHFSKLFVKYVGMSPTEYRKYRKEKAEQAELRNRESERH